MTPMLTDHSVKPEHAVRRGNRHLQQRPDAIEKLKGRAIRARPRRCVAGADRPDHCTAQTVRGRAMTSRASGRYAARGALPAWRALMEPEGLIEYLARTLRRLSQARRAIERQRAIVERLKSRKRDTRAAEALLRNFERSHALLLAAASRLREWVGTGLSRAR